MRANMKQILLQVTAFLQFLFLSSSHSQSTASRQVSTFSIESPQLKSSKKIWIYLPKDYETSTQKYPVIYMHDAQNLFDSKTSFVGEWNVDETLDSLQAKVIVVGIEHGNEKRLDELTPYKNEKHGGGNADAYLDFLVKTLKPEIDRKYRTKSGKRDTTIMGSSLGGLVSFYAVLKYPKVFGKAGIFSPSFWFTNDIYELAEKSPKIKAKIYFMCGDNEDTETVSDMEKMVSVVSKKQNNNQNLIKKVVVKGGQHNEKLWRNEFPKAYLWLK